MAELRCEGLSKSYGKRSVLRGVDLTVAQGTLTAILGASGSGKTTLLRIVMGLIVPDEGTVAVGGTIVADARDLDVATEKRSVGYMAQEGALFPHLTVGENVGFGLGRAERREGTRVSEALALVGLDDGYRGRRPQELSGGEQRRVGLARALAPRPRLVLLDEPFSGLDAGLRVDTREAVVSALAGEGTTAVLVTHDQAEALSMGSEVALLRGGRLVQSTTPTEIYRRPVDAGVARFVGEAMLLAGEASGGRVRCALGEIELVGAVREGAVEVMIRPEQVEMARLEGSGGVVGGGVAGGGVGTGGGAMGADVWARVLDHTYYGPDTVVRLALEPAGDVVVKTRTFAHDMPAAGELVALRVREPAVAYPRAGQASGWAARGAANPTSRSLG